jgi:type IV secretion system protein VirD4
MFGLGLGLGIGLVAYSGYGLYQYFDTENKICTHTELNALMGDGIQASKHVRLSIKTSNLGLLEVCPSGYGKSRGFVMPNINSLKNCSIICTDPSGEIASTCKTDKKVYIINPFSDNSYGINFLKNCKNEFEVRKMVNIILINGMNANKTQDNKNGGDQQEWVNMSIPLVTAYMLFNYYTEKYSFYEMIKNLRTKPIFPCKDESIISIYDEIQDSGIESAITELDAFIQGMNAIQTISSIRTVLNTCLTVFNDTNLKVIFDKPSIDIAKIREEESIIYIQIPEIHADYFSPFSATLITQLFDILIEKKEGLQVFCLFDEFCNIGILPNLDKLLSICRKRHISISACTQNLNQIYSLYGELKGKSINELFQTLIVCAGLRESSKEISEILGTKKQRDKNGNVSKIELMTPEQIREMESDKVIIICKNKRPVIDKMLDIVA